MKKQLKAAPCTITTFDNGEVVAVRTEVRARLRLATGYESEQGVSYTKQVIVTQETGEPLNIGKARNYDHAVMIGEAHLNAHQEHLGYEILPL